MSDPLAGFAPREAIPRFRSATPLTELGLGPEEGFVLSRVDGATRLGDLLQLVPFDPALTIEILRRLWLAGAIEIPGHAPPVITAAAPARAPVSSSTPASASSQAVPRVAIVPPDVELSIEQVQHVDEVFAQLRSKTAFELLGLERGASKKDVKRAYFKLSKEFHPDRFYGKKLGVYGDRLTQIFQAIKAAFDLLSDDERRAAYEESVFGG